MNIYQSLRNALIPSKYTFYEGLLQFSFCLSNYMFIPTISLAHNLLT